MFNRSFLVGLGVGGGEAHLYWRIRLTVIGAAFFTLAEIEMRAAAGGADQCSGGTPFAIGSTAGFEPFKAFNNTAGEWTFSRKVVGDYIGYQFAAPVSVKQIAISGVTGALPVDGLILEYSDDGTVYKPQKEWLDIMVNWVNGLNIFNV